MPSKAKTQKPQSKAVQKGVDFAAPLKEKSTASTSKIVEPEDDNEEEYEDEVEVEDGSGAEDDASDEDEDVDEEGMAKLMKALGEDGLDDFAQASLRALSGGEEGDSDEEDNDDDGEEVEDEEEVDGEGDEDGEEEEVPLDEAEEVDEDVVAHQKVEIDNKASICLSFKRVLRADLVV